MDDQFPTLWNKGFWWSYDIKIDEGNFLQWRPTNHLKVHHCVKVKHLVCVILSQFTIRRIVNDSAMPSAKLCCQFKLTKPSAFWISEWQLSDKQGHVYNLLILLDIFMEVGQSQRICDNQSLVQNFCLLWSLWSPNLHVPKFQINFLQSFTYTIFRNKRNMKLETSVSLWNANITNHLSTPEKYYDS